MASHGLLRRCSLTPHRRPAGWIRRLLPWLRPHRGNVMISFGAALVGSGIAAAVPAIERQIVDNVILHHRSPLWPWILALAGAAGVTFGASYLRRYRGGRLSLDVQFDLRNAIFDHLQYLDFARHDEMQTGQLVSRANSDVGLLQGLLAFLPIMSGNVLLLVASLIIMFVFSPLLALVSLIVVPLLGVTAYRMRKSTFPANWEAQQREGEVATVVEEAVTGVRVVKGFGQEDRELDHLVERAGVLYGSRVRAVRYQARFQPLLTAIPVLGQVAVLALGGWLALHHELSLGTFLAFATYLLQLAAPARMLAGVLLVAQQARAGAERVLDLLASTPTVVDAPDAEQLPVVHGEVTFDDVRFGYLSSEPVLDDFSLHVAAGETIALVGGSGSGKSTVAQLLPRFYDVQQGTVRIDGTDVRHVTLASLRAQIGVVFEESFLFSDTVRANIAYGRPDATEEEIEMAAAAAEAQGFIAALPDGYDTVVGERGLSLSGGQRQRIALARALITDPRILILDDATSAVDARTEEALHATLRRVMQNRTTLLIAHRRSTLRLADRIMVLDGGKVLDQGTHDELMVHSPLYRALLTTPGSELADEAPSPAAPLSLVTGRSPALAPAGITPSAWPEASGREARTGPSSSGGWTGGLVATPDLLQRVAALPPASERPDPPTEEQRRWDPNFTLRAFIRPFRRPLALGLLLVLIDALATLSGPLLIRWGLDSGVSDGSYAILWLATGAFLAVTLADYVDSVYQVLVTGRTAERLLFALRVRIWSQLQRLGIDFYDRELGGRIMTRMTTDVDALSTLLQSGLINALVALFTFLGVGIALVVMNWALGLITLSIIVPLAAATVVYRRLSGQAYRSARERIAVVNANLQESLSGVREAQAFVREGRNRRQFRELSGGYLRARLRAQRLVSLYFPFIEFLSDVAAVLVLGIGSVLIARGSLSTGELIAFLLYLDLFFNPIQQLSQTFDSYQQAGASMAQINDLMKIPTTTPKPANPLPHWDVLGRVTFEQLRFSYPSVVDEALRGLDLEVEPGETVALVGETGAGKSTVIKLVTRFYDPTAGSVRVDGRDLRQVDLTWYRNQLGYVPQEAFLFSGTVRDNIAYGRPDARDAEVEAAARAVGAHDFVASLVGGYLHQINERGRSLSAGQRQLIALARAQLVDPKILLLDEATSNLDLATEAKVSEAMGLLAQGRTTILIAHRLATAARADRVVVMEHGRVVETGPHRQLLAAGGRYAQMWQTSEAGGGTHYPGGPAIAGEEPMVATSS